jgi:hypothetical protein
MYSSTARLAEMGLVRVGEESGVRPCRRTSPISANRAVLEYMLRESVALPTDLALLAWLRLTGRQTIE